MSAEVLVDTSVLVAVFRGDPRSDAAAAIQGDAAAVVSAMAVAEIQSLVAHGSLHEMAPAETLEMARVEPVTLDDALEGGKVHGELRRQGHANVGLADALALATARRLGIPLVTLDGDLEGEEGVIVVR